jgi:hypothetical protein
LRERSSDREIARQALLKARNPEQYEYDDATFESHVSRIVRLFTKAVPTVTKDVKPALVTDYPKESGERCGFTYEKDDQLDRKYLFIKKMHTEDETEGPSITSFYVRMSVYFPFFGRSLGAPLSTGASDHNAARPSAPEELFVRSLWDPQDRDKDTSYVQCWQ